MEFWIEIFVCIAASLGAGLGTGLAGMSAAAVISPMLSTFLGVPAYQAIGIALASDVLASAFSAVIYGFNKHLDIKGGLLLLVCVVVFTYFGSIVSVHVGNQGLGVFSLFVTFLVGLQFLFNPESRHKKALLGSRPDPLRDIKTALCGAVIGIVCGGVGAGGGMMMLIVLTGVLHYDLKKAVGTSVFVMAFTAFTGSVTHFAVGGVWSWQMLALCCLLTCLFAQIASSFAAYSSERLQKRVTGGVLVALAIGMLVFRML